ncbi:MAG: hypothetical protein DRZ90_09340 [Spirochaetes bacterium]|nr:MAG: hypothetical protein DRP60_04995 [Spirochaetota bacterium]RKX96093.1 MAG: hypothetical protein DRZ90_09340 [Spirochaetota bacterium]
MVLPPSAAAAGLGEIGRHGLLVTKNYGSRVRISAVTTNLSGGLSLFRDSLMRKSSGNPRFLLT